MQGQQHHSGKVLFWMELKRSALAKSPSGLAVAVLPSWLSGR